MIIGNIRNRARYAALGEDIMQALDYFAEAFEHPETAVKEFADIMLPGDRVMIRVRPLHTSPMGECVMEAHYKELDIHVVTEGIEKMVLTDVKGLTVIKEDPDQDVYFMQGTCDNVVTMTKGTFVIAYPEDAHMTCVAVDEPMPIVRMIAKIKAEEL